MVRDKKKEDTPTQSASLGDVPSSVQKQILSYLDPKSRRNHQVVLLRGEIDFSDDDESVASTLNGASFVASANVLSFLDIDSMFTAAFVSKDMLGLLGRWDGPLLGSIGSLMNDIDMPLEITSPDMMYNTYVGSCENIQLARRLWKVSTLYALYVTVSPLLQHQRIIPHNCFILYLLGLSTTRLQEYPCQDQE